MKSSPYNKRSNNRRAQSSMEFVILTGFMLLAFMSFYIVIQSKLVEANRDTTDILAKQVETIIVSELKTAESVSDGYYREFDLPYTINGIDYDISMISGVGGTLEIVVQYNGKERVYFILQDYVDISSDIGNGRNSISKNNGIIEIHHMP